MLPLEGTYLVWADCRAAGLSSDTLTRRLLDEGRLHVNSGSMYLSERLREKGITVNAADPGIVSTDIITMHQWFDPLTDIFFRPFIRTPKKGASTAVGLLLDEAVAGVSGQLYAGNRRKELSDNYIYHVQKEQLWEITEQLLAQWFT